MRATILGFLLSGALLLACSSETGDGSAGGGGSSGSGSATGTGSSSGTGSVTPLSDHERYLLGVWKATISVENQTFGYFVLQDDRTGCLWDRHGTDFGQRYFELQFDDWHLEETPLDADGRMTISLRSSNGEIQKIDRYDPEIDRLFQAGLLSMTWQDITIPCNSKGTNATAVDVMRQGTAPL